MKLFGLVNNLFSGCISCASSKSIDELWQDLEDETVRADSVGSALLLSRFKDIPCARATALQTSGGRYLHANRMGLGISERKLIASQYPFADELWMAVYREGAALVDLTGPRDRMIPYYPVEGETALYNGIEVRFISTQNGLSIYRVHPPGLEPKYIARFHFSAWLDYGVISVDQLCELVSRVESIAPNDPIWAHCRAGVGRTGALITALILKEQIRKGKIQKENLDKELVNLVLRLRSERNHYFVQTKEQFRLLYDYALSLLRSC